MSPNHPYGYSSPTKKCKFLVLEYSLNIMSEGEAKFTVGLGLIIYFFLQLIICLFKIDFKSGMEDAQKRDEVPQSEDNPDLGTGFFGMLRKMKSKASYLWNHPEIIMEYMISAALSGSIIYFFTLFVGSQQSLVMFPLTNMQANPYCATFVVPTSDVNAVCL